MSTATVNEAVRKVLIDHATVAALVAARVYSGEAPVGALAPFLVINQDDNEHEHDMSGASGYKHTQLVIDGFALTYAGAEALLDAMRLALDGYRDTVTTGSGKTLKIHHCFLDNDSIESVKPESGEGQSYYNVISKWLVVSPETVPTFA